MLSFTRKLLLVGLMVVAGAQVEGFACSAPRASQVRMSANGPSPQKVPQAPWRRAIAGVAFAAYLAAAPIDPSQAAILQSPVCIDGSGDGCDALSGGSELIKSLQAKSAANKDKYERETLDRYNQHNFQDYFRALNAHMVQHKDGKYEILTDAQYFAQERAGKVYADRFLEE